jgi:transposase
MTKEARVVIGGVDTHKDIHVAAVVDDRGKILGTEEFETTAKGYRALVAWMTGFGEVQCVGVEGTGTYGAGLARHLAEAGLTVIEVNRPDRQARRRRGKSDTVDAEAAARAALNGEATVDPKAQGGLVESIRVLRVAFTSARDSRTRVALQIRDLIITAPDPLRATLGSLDTAARVARCARFRIGGGDPGAPLEGTRLALRALARRYDALSAEMAELEHTLDELTARANPALRSARGVGVDVAAILLVAAGDNPRRIRSEGALAKLCGASPVEASSGKVVRHRLNRSGNRQANHALWRIAMVRLNCDEATKKYAARRSAEGKSPREIMRCLKRYIAREMFRHLTNPQTIPRGHQLRSDRVAAGISLEAAARAIGSHGIRLSELERGLRFDLRLAERYQSWLMANAAA